SASLADRFIRRGGEVIDRIHAEKTLEQPQCRRLPVKSQYAELYRIEAYLTAFGKRAALDERLLRLSAEYYKAAAAELEGEDWTEITQYNYLTGVQLYLMAGDGGKAEEMLASRRSFRKQVRHHKLLVTLAGVRQGKVAADDAMAEFDSVF